MAKIQKSIAAQQHSKQVQSVTSTYYVPSPAPRKPIYLMDKAEFEAWQQQTIDALKALQIQSPTTLQADLLEALVELTILRAMAEVDQSLQSNQQHSGNTGMLMLYDDGKLKV